MSKQMYFMFGNTNGASYSGFAPTFTLYNWNGITALPPPGISELAAGTGIYGFQYGGTQSIVFIIDGGAGIGAASTRFIVGSLDPIMMVDQSIGYKTDSFGSTNVDPTTIFGQVKRTQEFNEGNKVFTKSSGIWDVYSRGSSALLREKTLTNTTSAAGSS